VLKEVLKRTDIPEDVRGRKGVRGAFGKSVDPRLGAKGRSVLRKGVLSQGSADRRIIARMFQNSN